MYVFDFMTDLVAGRLATAQRAVESGSEQCVGL